MDAATQISQVFADYNLPLTTDQAVIVLAALEAARAHLCKVYENYEDMPEDAIATLVGVNTALESVSKP